MELFILPGNPPLLYELIPKCSYDAGLLKKPGLKHIIVESLSDTTLASAQKLNKIYAAYEEEIFTASIIFGKETVQNIMRVFEVPIYEPIWEP